jgi:hypothetical protein
MIPSQVPKTPEASEPASGGSMGGRSLSCGLPGAKCRQARRREPDEAGAARRSASREGSRLDGHGLMLIRNAEPERIRTAPAAGAFPHRSACPAGQVAPPSLVGSAGVAGRIGSPARVKGRWARTGPGPRCQPRAPDLRRKYAITPSSSLTLIRPLGCSPLGHPRETRRDSFQHQPISSTSQEDGLQAPASLPASSR